MVDGVATAWCLVVVPGDDSEAAVSGGVCSVR